MGSLLLFLHAHLPFVRHPDRPGALEEDWLFQAIADVYLPLAGLFEGWWRDDVPVRLSMSITPTLAEMLRDELLQQRAEARLVRLLRLAERETRRVQSEPYRSVARMYRDRLEQQLVAFRETYRRDLVDAFGHFQTRGQLEIATSAATHANLPLLGVEASYARAQIRVGVRSYREHFGRDPVGFWLPECAYATGLDQLLADEGIRYFFLDTHGVANADPAPAAGHEAPLVCPSGVTAFARDPACAEQVWSATIGYPGDPRYRERYRDWGFDLPDTLLEGLLLDNGARRHLGLGYHRITSPDVDLGDKAPYDRLAAMDAVEEHAAHFVAERAKDARQTAIDTARVMVAPYDAELFGHWWFEGPEWLNRVIRRSAEQSAFAVATPSDVLDGGERFQLARPARSTWGRGGHAEVWLNKANDWIWPRLHDAARRMAQIATARPEARGEERRAINQLGRELLLASASDWPFIVTYQTVVEYAESRVRQHLERFDALYAEVSGGMIDSEKLRAFEAEDNAFPNLDFRDFA